jgi:hypothetical protein
MKTLPRSDANIAWNGLWSSLKTEWFKVEVLQDYSAEDKGESLSAWMSGDRERSIELLKAESHEWADDCRNKVEHGVQLTRIHVVEYPLSEYVQWEVEVYKNRNIPLGREDVYLVDRQDISELALPAGDLMMFDMMNVVIGNYDETGYAVTQTFYNEEDDISEFLNLRGLLLKANLTRVDTD